MKSTGDLSFPLDSLRPAKGFLRSNTENEKIENTCEFDVLLLPGYFFFWSGQVL